MRVLLLICGMINWLESGPIYNSVGTILVDMTDRRVDSIISCGSWNVSEFEALGLGILREEVTQTPLFMFGNLSDQLIWKLEKDGIY